MSTPASRISAVPLLLIMVSLLSNLASVIPWYLAHQLSLPFLQDPTYRNCATVPGADQPAVLWAWAAGAAVLGLACGVIAFGRRPPLRPARAAVYAVLSGAVLGILSNLLMVGVIAVSALQFTSARSCIG
ncbi:MAG TPA: hypothetical protein VF807_11305 [Ktedonobacterales bacterium]